MKYSIVSAVRCESYNQELLSKNVQKALSNILSEDCIKPNSKVLLKPNLLTAKPPEEAVTTHPEFLRAIIKFLKSKGVEDISLGDSPAGQHSWEHLWEITGMKKLSLEEDIKLLPFSNFIKYKHYNNNVPILKEFNQFDFIISVPKLKTHLLTKMTGAVKNSYGFVIGTSKTYFHGIYPSPQKISNFLSSIFALTKPHLSIMDAIECMEGDGPNAGKVKSLGVIFASSDALALDSCACMALGYKYYNIPMLKRTEELGLGNGVQDNIMKKGDAWNLVNKSSIKSCSKSDFLYKIPEKMFFLVTFLLKCRPFVDKQKCKQCGLCKEACSQNAITIISRKSGKVKIKTSKCILCMCCIEACPYKALHLRGTLLLRSINKIYSFFTK